MKEFAAAEWQKAHRALAAAHQLIDTDPDSAASRAYYAAFHGVTAMFALKGRCFTKHTALRAAVHQELVKPGIWSVDMGQAYDFLLELRETGDYGGVEAVSRDSARLAHCKAEQILKAVECLRPELARSPGTGG